MKKTAICPGSFDPVTVGHFDLATRAAQIFDEVIVLIMDNAEKSHMFSAAQRLLLCQKAFEGIPNIRVDMTAGLLARYAQEKNAVIVKGVRGAIDCDYEISLASINKNIGNTETVFLPPKGEYSHISSSFAREMIRFGVSLDGVVPASAAEELEKILNR